MPRVPQLLSLFLAASAAPDGVPPRQDSQGPPPAAPAAAADPLVWDARAAEHLLDRAGFGATPEEVLAAVAGGRAAVVDDLVHPAPFQERPFYSPLRGTSELAHRLGALSPTERRKEARRVRAEDSRQLNDFLEWWVERMLRGDDPLRERMTLFWHGWFTSSQQDVKNSYAMIAQNQFLRENALGSFSTLVHGIARDPAMLEYLDNRTNRKERPNENFARELMELFTLGEGNYTEDDVKASARAFTGWTTRDVSFAFARKRHDDGEKTFLGVTGDLDGDDVIDALLAQPACARHLAAALVTWFEGVPPAADRLERYAQLLRDEDYQIAPFLAHLFEDPAFYRHEVVGTRITSPIDFLIGMARRLRCEPPARMILAGAAALGQRLFYPPNVKGWAGGAAWITTSSVMLRGNLAGVLLGEVTERDLERPAASAAPDADGDEPTAADEPARKKGSLGGVRVGGWRPRLNLGAELRHAGVRRDGEIVDALVTKLLAVPVDRTTRRALLEELASEREALGIASGKLLADDLRCEPVLRRLAHVVLCLPEAQLD